MNDIFLLVAGSLVAALAGTALIRRYALWRDLMDHPTERSSHTRPTPRGGGLAIVLSSMAGFSVLAAWGWLTPRELAALAGGLAVAGVGFVDDHGHVSAPVRFGVHLLAAAWALWWLGVWALAADAVSPQPLAWLLTAFFVAALAWLVNLYNFMDGIDGIAAGEALFVGLAGALLAGPLTPAGAALLVLAAAGAGFLVLNLPPARIFMGDVGSGYLGYAVGVLLTMAVLRDGLSFWAGLILLAVFVADATVTLVRRMLGGQRWYEAHRSHAYQILSRRWGSHGRVTLATAAVNVLWLWPLAWLADRQPAEGGIFAAIAYLPLAGIALWVGAGRTERAGE